MRCDTEGMISGRKTTTDKANSDAIEEERWSYSLWKQTGQNKECNQLKYYKTRWGVELIFFSARFMPSLSNNRQGQNNKHHHHETTHHLDFDSDADSLQKMWCLHSFFYKQQFTKENNTIIFQNLHQFCWQPFLQLSIIRQSFRCQYIFWHCPCPYTAAGYYRWFRSLALRPKNARSRNGSPRG